MKNYDELQPHQQRVVDEMKALMSKYEALVDSISKNDVYKELHEIDRHLLQLQESAMSLYLDVLFRRIARF